MVVPFHTPARGYEARLSHIFTNTRYCRSSSSSFSGVTYTLIPAMVWICLEGDLEGLMFRVLGVALLGGGVAS
jgi:hypothetical protein